MSLETNRNRLRRLRVLQKLSMAYPDPLSGRVLLSLLMDDLELEPDLTKVRRSLQYLADRGLVQIINQGEKLWMAKITPDGVDYLEGDTGIDGVAHPMDFTR